MKRKEVFLKILPQKVFGMADSERRHRSYCISIGNVIKENPDLFWQLIIRKRDTVRLQIYPKHFLVISPTPIQNIVTLPNLWVLLYFTNTPVTPFPAKSFLSITMKKR